MATRATICKSPKNRRRVIGFASPSRSLPRRVRRNVAMIITAPIGRASGPRKGRRKSVSRNSKNRSRILFNLSGRSTCPEETS